MERTINGRDQMPERKRVTLKDIANATGYSVPLVSVALSGKCDGTTKLSDTTREKVIKAAKEMNYKPNIFGRSLRANKSFLVGVLFFDVNDWLMGDFLYGAQHVLSEAGYAPIFLSHATKEEQRHNLEICMDRRVDGIILNLWINEDTGEADSEFVFKTLGEKFPALEVYGYHMPEAISTTVDFQESFYAMCCDLIAGGAKRIAMVNHEKYDLGGDEGTLFINAWQCAQGYKRAMEEHNLSIEMALHPLSRDKSPTAAAVAMAENAGKTFRGLVEKDGVPDAIVCMNDEQAFGVLRTCVDMGVKVPDDMSIRGVGNTSVGKLAGISTCDVSAMKVGSTAAQSILKLINNEKVESSKIFAPLILRNT